MTSRAMKVCFCPSVRGGGPASFQSRLASALAARGLEVTFDLGQRPLDGVLIFAATRNLAALVRCRREGIPLVQRLDGINWLHRVRPVTPTHYLRAEGRNLLLRMIRSRFADRIIYQSEFVRTWWQAWYGPARSLSTVVRNGVALDEFAPRGAPLGPGTLICVEGALRIDRVVRAMLLGVSRGLRARGGISRVIVLGKVLDSEAREVARAEGIEFLGPQSQGDVRRWQSAASLHLSLDLNSACPNSVIEALAAGLPVLGYDTGALRELIAPGAGELVRYDGDPWRLEVPGNLAELVEAGEKILRDWSSYSSEARATAARNFDLKRVAEAYETELRAAG